MIGILRWMFERQLEVGEPGPDGTAPGDRSAAQNLEIMAARLAGLRRRVEVVTPTLARDSLARIGAELGALYGACRHRDPPPSPMRRSGLATARGTLVETSRRR